MEKSDNKAIVIKKVLVALITILLIAYIVSVVLKSNFTQVKTEAGNIMTVSDAIPVSGYFIRDEYLIENNEKGIVSYNVTDGSKISKNEAVADVFENEDAAADHQTLKRLEQQITGLQQLNKTAKTLSATPDEIDKTINDTLNRLNLNVNSGNLSDTAGNIDSLLYSLNERQIVTGKTADYSEKVKELQNKVSTLKKTTSKTQSKQIPSPATGYFCAATDGYEKAFTTADLKKLKTGDLAENKIKKTEIGSNVIGKTLEGVNWYVACEVTAEEALKIKRADAYGYLGVDIPSVSSSIISVSLECVNQESQTSDALVVLKGNFMNAALANVRREDISIVLRTYKGIYVSKSAIHECVSEAYSYDEKEKKLTDTKELKGVYALIGNELKFKQVIVLYTDKNFVVCKINADKQDWVSSEFGLLKPYDNVVVEGANLYDGKIIN